MRVCYRAARRTRPRERAWSADGGAELRGRADPRRLAPLRKERSILSERV